MIQNIALALDSTVDPKPALDVAVSLALNFHSKLLLLGISNSPIEEVIEVHIPDEEITPLQTPEDIEDEYASFRTYPYEDVLPLQTPKTPESLKDAYDGFRSFPFYFPADGPQPIEKIKINSVEDDEMAFRLSQLQKEVTDQYNRRKLPAGDVSWRVEDGRFDTVLKNLAGEDQPDLVVLPYQQPEEDGLKHHLTSHRITTILRHTRLPVLVVPKSLKLNFLKEPGVAALAGIPKYFIGSSKGTIVVTLDGSKEAEAALPMAAEFARTLKLPLYLLMVMPNDEHSQYEDPESAMPLEIRPEQPDHNNLGNDYLCFIQEKLVKQGINCHRVVLQGKAEDRIPHYLEKTHPVLSIIATHARPKLEQLILGSVAEKVLQANSGLVLLVPTSHQKHFYFELEEPLVEKDGNKEVVESGIYSGPGNLKGLTVGEGEGGGQ